MTTMETMPLMLADELRERPFVLANSKQGCALGDSLVRGTLKEISPATPDGRMTVKYTCEAHGYGQLDQLDTVDWTLVESIDGEYLATFTILQSDYELAGDEVHFRTPSKTGSTARVLPALAVAAAA